MTADIDVREAVKSLTARLDALDAIAKQGTYRAYRCYDGHAATALTLHVGAQCEHGDYVNVGPLVPAMAAIYPAHLRILLDRLKHLEQELNEQREYVAALNEAQVGLQTSAFRRGWWTCRTAMQQAVDFTQSELATLEYAKQVREVTVAQPAALSDGASAETSPKPVVCGSNEWHLDASGAAWEPNKEGNKPS